MHMWRISGVDTVILSVALPITKRGGKEQCDGVFQYSTGNANTLALEGQVSRGAV